jgi:hypothetical protein
MMATKEAMNTDAAVMKSANGRGVDQTCAKSYGELWLNLDHKDSIGK